MLRILGFLLLTASLAGAAVKSCPTGLLTATPITTSPTASSDVVVVHNVRGITFQAQNTAGTASVQIEACCMGACGATGPWAAVLASPLSLTVNSAVTVVVEPACQYRASTTACTTCSVTVGYACSGT